MFRHTTCVVIWDSEHLEPIHHVDPCRLTLFPAYPSQHIIEIVPVASITRCAQVVIKVNSKMFEVCLHIFRISPITLGLCVPGAPPQTHEACAHPGPHNNTPKKKKKKKKKCDSNVDFPYPGFPHRMKTKHYLQLFSTYNI